MDKILSFNNRKFKIMQIADIQEDIPVNPDTMKLIRLSIEKEKPDLIVLTGDQIQAYHTCYKNDSLNKVRECIYSFASIFKEYGIPFTMTFGNHDDDGPVDKQTQLDIYREFDNFILGQQHNDSDIGTHALRIYSIDNKPAFNIYLIDSNKTNSLGSYQAVKKEQIEWFKGIQEEYRTADGEYLPSFVFQHIPVPEFYDVLVKAPKRIKGSVEAYHSRKNTFWTLPYESLSKGDFMYESPAVPEENTGEFKALKEKGNILGIFVGHDHNNSFVINKDGIDLGYCQGCGFNTYGPSDQRGVRIFVLDEDDIRNYKTYTVQMKDLCDYKPAKPFKEFILSNMPSSVNDALSLAKRSLIPIAAAGAAAYVIKKIF